MTVEGNKARGEAGKRLVKRLGVWAWPGGDRSPSHFLASVLCIVLPLAVIVACEVESPPQVPSIRHAPAKASMPLLFDSTDALVYLSIGGHDSLRFLIDSGGRHMFISAPLSRRLGSSMSPLGEGVGGRPIVKLDSFQIGPVTFGTVGARVAAPPLTVQRRWNKGHPYDGLLGWALLGRVDMAYDLSRNRLWLFAASPRSPRRSPVWSVVPDSFRCASPPLLHGDGRTRLTIQDETFPALLDTGASPSVVSWKVARAAGISRDSARRLKERTHGLDTSAAGKLTYLSSFGGAYIGPVPLDSAQVRILDQIGARNEGYQALIGNDLLTGAIAVQADSAGSQVRYVCRS